MSVRTAAFISSKLLWSSWKISCMARVGTIAYGRDLFAFRHEVTVLQRDACSLHWLSANQQMSRDLRDPVGEMSSLRMCNAHTVITGKTFVKGSVRFKVQEQLGLLHRLCSACCGVASSRSVAITAFAFGQHTAS